MEFIQLIFGTGKGIGGQDSTCVRQFDREYRSLGAFAFTVYLALMHIDNLFGDRQTQSRTLNRPHIIGPVEAFKQPVHVPSWNANPLLADGFDGRFGTVEDTEAVFSPLG